LIFSAILIISAKVNPFLDQFHDSGPIWHQEKLTSVWNILPRDLRLPNFNLYEVWIYGRNLHLRRTMFYCKFHIEKSLFNAEKGYFNTKQLNLDWQWEMHWSQPCRPEFEIFAGQWATKSQRVLNLCYSAPAHMASRLVIMDCEWMVLITFTSHCCWNCLAQSLLGYIYQSIKLFSSWQNTVAQLVNPTDPKSRNPPFYSCSMDFSNSGCGSFIFATCAQLGVWASGQRLASFTSSSSGLAVQQPSANLGEPWDQQMILSSWKGRVRITGGGIGSQSGWGKTP
jgi:hypothetical protein